jgi:hypothetical protein
MGQVPARSSEYPSERESCSEQAPEEARAEFELRGHCDSLPGIDGSRLPGGLLVEFGGHLLFKVGLSIGKHLPDSLIRGSLQALVVDDQDC